MSAMNKTWTNLRCRRQRWVGDGDEIESVSFLSALAPPAEVRERSRFRGSRLSAVVAGIYAKLVHRPVSLFSSCSKCQDTCSLQHSHPYVGEVLAMQNPDYPGETHMCLYTCSCPQDLEGDLYM